MMEEWKERQTDYDGLLQHIELVIGSYITASGQNDRLSNKNKTFFPLFYLSCSLTSKNRG